MRSKPHLEQLTIVGMNPSEPFLGRSADLVFGVPKHGFPAWRKKDLVAGDIPIPQTVVGAARSQCIACFAFTQRRLNTLGRADVAKYRHAANDEILCILQRSRRNAQPLLRGLVAAAETDL